MTDTTLPSESTSLEVLGIGTVLIDHQVVLDRYPAANTKNPISLSRYQVGGPVPTALAFLRRMGVGCQFIGKWAGDEFGRQIQDDFVRQGIDFRPSIISPDNFAQTGFAHVWIDQHTGERTVAYSRGSCGDLDTNELPSEPPASHRLLHLDGWSALAATNMAQRFQAHGKLVVLDAGSPKPNLDQLLPHVTLINCPERFCQEYFGHTDIRRAAAALLDKGIKMAVFTAGERGAELFTADQHLVQPAFSVRAVDTTGAGDVFCGALSFGLLQNWPLDQLLRFAAAAAAIKCRQLGNRDALPDFAAVQALALRED
ncbi:MAG: carbohydrate kinase family protein [Pirellulaceae bacterium]